MAPSSVKRSEALRSWPQRFPYHTNFDMTLVRRNLIQECTREECHEQLTADLNLKFPRRKDINVLP